MTLAGTPAAPAAPARRVRRPLAQTAARLLGFACLLVVAAACVYPLAYMLMAALKPAGEYTLNPFGLPRQPTGRNLTAAWAVMAGSFGVSALVVGCAMVGSWVVCTLAAYAVARLEFPGRRAAFYGILGSMVVADQTLLVPLHRQMVDLHLAGRPLGLILVYTAFSLPFGTYLLTSYFRSIPHALTEAAQLDGAGHVRILCRVIVPIALPAMMTLGIFNFLWMWNELLFALVLMPSTHTLTVEVASLSGQRGANFPLTAAGLFISAVPVLLVFLLFQSRIAKGMTAGAVK